MIEFKNITKSFKNNFWEKPNRVLDNISFKISKGDLVGFLGANGAGKTTLIKILMDFSRADSGEVIFSDGLGINIEAAKSRIGYLPEKPYLYPYLTGREFLIYAAQLNEISISEIDSLIEKYSIMLKIDFALDRPIKTYSKGMQQRLGFISSIIHNPKFLILDEPLSGLDPVGRIEFKKILKDLNNEGVTIFFSSHVVSDVEEICNKIIFIEKGKLFYDGEIESLIEKNNENLTQIKYFLDNKLIEVEIPDQERVKTLKDLINKDAEIIKVEKKRVTLEQIIYKVKR